MMKAFKAIMDIYSCVSYCSLATSAMREAKNGNEVIEKVYKETGIKIEIIDGKRKLESFPKSLKLFHLMKINMFLLM